MDATIAKAKEIKLFIFDIDGVMTPGVIYYGNANTEYKGFHIHDGVGIKLLQKAGIEVAVISGKKSDAVARRLEDLKIKHTYLGHEHKIPAYDELKSKLNLTDKQIAYMGDDLPDLPLFRRASLSITVPQAPDIMKQHADFITIKKAGKGAVREACEFVLHAQNKMDAVLKSYLTD